MIVERPILYDLARQRRTVAYRQRHEDPRADSHRIEPRVIVLHHTGGGSLDATWRYFNRPTIDPHRLDLVHAGRLGLSAHFLIDRDGTIVRLLPERSMARHAIGLNHLAIGVENVGDGDRFPLTDAQVAANRALVRDLKRRFPGITHLIGHHELRTLATHPYFKERAPGSDVDADRSDPGPAFMKTVREGLTDLDLSPTQP